MCNQGLKMLYSKTEDEIISHWNINIDTPVVSVCCITYNHESFIEDALLGFLKQETEFPFEILVHDDASTDRTAEIILHYAKEYPRIIKPIFQLENQYSKLPIIAPRFLYPSAKGEFIAICEGDDYWVNPQKLKMQVAEFKKDERVTLVHTDVGQLVSYSSHFDRICWGINKRFNRKVPQDNFRRKSWETFGVYTCSVMIKKSVADEFFSSGAINSGTASGDYAIFLFAAQRGNIAYLDEPTAIYRENKKSITKSDRRNFIRFSTGTKSFLIFALNYFQANDELTDQVLKRANNEIYYTVLNVGKLSDLRKPEVSSSMTFGWFLFVAFLKILQYESVYGWMLYWKRKAKILLYYTLKD
jgi:glycosyltransferase involved in cell wall biosynthesis